MDIISNKGTRRYFDNQCDLTWKSHHNSTLNQSLKCVSKQYGSNSD